MIRLSAGSLVIVLACWGCGSSDKQKSVSQQASPATSNSATSSAVDVKGFTLNDLVGIWSSPCIEVEPKIYAVMSYKFNEDGSGEEQLSQGYLDAACKNPADAKEYPSNMDPFKFKVGKSLNEKRVTSLTLTYTQDAGYTSFLIKGNQLMFSKLVESEALVSAAVDESEVYTKK